MDTDWKFSRPLGFMNEKSWTRYLEYGDLRSTATFASNPGSDSYQHIIMPLSSGLGYLTSTTASCSSSLGKMLPTNLLLLRELFYLLGDHPFKRVQFKAESEVCEGSLIGEDLVTLNTQNGSGIEPWIFRKHLRDQWRQ